MSIERSVAIDGPAGAGKSTVANLMALKLGYRYVSTGDLYRALTLAVIRRGADPNREQDVLDVAKSCRVWVEPASDGGQRTLLDDEDVSELIRGADVDSAVSPVSVHPEVRKLMVEAQRNIARGSDVVMDGRDIGAVVLAESKYKFFLTASAQERARRRMLDYARRGIVVDVDTISREIAQRDKIDSERSVAPLRPVEGAVVIDCTSMTPEEVVQQMLDVLGRAGVCCMQSEER